MADTKLTSEEMAALDLLIRAKQLASGTSGEEAAAIGALARVTRVAVKAVPHVLNAANVAIGVAQAAQLAQLAGGRQLMGTERAGGRAEQIPEDVTLEQLLELRQRATTE